MMVPCRSDKRTVLIASELRSRQDSLRPPTPGRARKLLVHAICYDPSLPLTQRRHGFWSETPSRIREKLGDNNLK